MRRDKMTLKIQAEIDGRAYTILDGDYRVWQDGQVWRWARARYVDDGVGLPAHGSEGSLALALGAAIVNAELHDAVPDEGRSPRMDHEPEDWQAQLLEEWRAQDVTAV